VVLYAAADIDGPLHMQLVLHPVKNVQPVQLVVQEMAESAVVLLRVADDASGSIITRWSLSVVDLDAPAKMALQ